MIILLSHQDEQDQQDNGKSIIWPRIKADQAKAEALDFNPWGIRFYPILSVAREKP